MKNKLECCGNCKYFLYEDINGNGWCAMIKENTTCGENCNIWVKNKIYDK